MAASVIRGLAEHKATLGRPLCPCRYYEDKEAEAKAKAEGGSCRFSSGALMPAQLSCWRRHWRSGKSMNQFDERMDSI